MDRGPPSIYPCKADIKDREKTPFGSPITLQSTGHHPVPPSLEFPRQENAVSPPAIDSEKTHTSGLHLFLVDVALLAHIQTVQEFSDILVSHPADLLDVGGGL